jgi:segregation and condensation protein A
VSIAPATGGAAVVLHPGARPERAAHVRLGDFDGPLALLLSLIEQRQLDILEVRLGDLCAAFLDAVIGEGDERLPHLSVFIEVASQLILIKSRAMLPRAPDPVSVAETAADPEAELRARLIEYKRYRDAGARLGGRLDTGTRMSHREAAPAQAAAQAGARAPDGPPLPASALVEALERSLRLSLPPAPPPAVVPRTVTLAERAAVLRRALQGAPAVVLQELLGDLRDRVVVVVTFLAMLELVKTRELRVEQAEPWGPIICRAVGPGG